MRKVEQMLMAMCIVGIVASTTIAAPISKSHSKKTPQHSTKEHQRRTPGSQYPPAQAKKIIAKRAQKAVLALKKNDTNLLSQYVHPDWGVRIMPSIWRHDSDQVFSRTQVKSLAKSDKVYLWNYKSIRKTWKQYLHGYLYTHDFVASHDVVYNTIIKMDAGVNNLKHDYPNAILVRYYMPGPKDKEWDWKELWLIWQRTSKGNDWYLVGIGEKVLEQ